MKRFLPVLAVILAFTCTLATDNVYAKKFGSSKSFGRSFQTAPSQSKLFSQKSYNQNGFQQNGFQQKSFGSNSYNGYKAPQKQRGMFSGAMGGFLGGMLAGGLISSLFGGHSAMSGMGSMGGMGSGFTGLRFMDILVLAGLAFLLFKLFKGFARSRMGGGSGSGKGYYHNSAQWQNPSASSGQGSHLDGSNFKDSNFRDSISGFRPGDASNSTGSAASQPDARFTETTFKTPSRGGGFSTGTADDIPLNLPPDFDLNGFLNRARSHYRTVQDAWNSGDMNTLRDYVSPDLFQHLQRERAALAGDQHTEVMYVDAELVRAEHVYGRTELSLRFRGQYRDNVERIEEKITDIWHLEQSAPDAPWLIVGIEYSDD